MAAAVPPRSTTATSRTGSAPASRTAWAASSSEVPRVTVSSVTTTLSPGSRAPAMRPPAAVVLGLLAHAEGLEGPAPGGRHPGGDEGHRVGAHGQPADGGGLVGDHGEHGLGHQQHGLGPADRLLGVDEPLQRRPDLSTKSPRRTEWASRWCAQLAEGRVRAVRSSQPHRARPRPVTSPTTAARRPAAPSAPSTARLGSATTQHHAEAEVEHPGHLVVLHLAQPGDLVEEAGTSQASCRPPRRSPRAAAGPGCRRCPPPVMWAQACTPPAATAASTAGA